MLCLSYYLLCFLFNKIRGGGWNSFCPEAGRERGGKGGVSQTMYTHVSKCKNDKVKERKEKKKDSLQRLFS
jgi:hypothetical protein